MLTDNEREWLNSRKSDLVSPGSYFCGQCQVQCFTLEKPCPLQITGKNWRDAAEFEERVAAKLAIMMYQLAANSLSRDFSCEKSCVAHIVCKKDKSCIYAFLKYARISVEEEMENEIA